MAVETKTVRKTYYNCDPIIPTQQTLFDGNGFEYTNGGQSEVWLALESDLIVGVNQAGYWDSLTDWRFGSGKYDPATKVKVRPNETITLWKKDTACEVPNMKCDGSEGREIVVLRENMNSEARQYTLEGFDICTVICCQPEAPAPALECCDQGVVCNPTCEAAETSAPCG